jgi:hypothetical protein
VSTGCAWQPGAAVGIEDGAIVDFKGCCGHHAAAAEGEGAGGDGGCSCVGVDSGEGENASAVFGAVPEAEGEDPETVVSPAPPKVIGALLPLTGALRASRPESELRREAPASCDSAWKER